MMKKFRAGIVGCGNIFPMHAYPVHSIENVELVAICDVQEDLARKKAEEFNCKHYTDYKEMIEQGSIDVIHICTPHFLHAPIAICAAEHGVNILTEKPMAIQLPEAEAMVKAARDHHVTLGVIFQNRYNPGSILIKNTLDSGELGKVLSGRLSVTWNRSDEYYSKSSWKGTWEKEGGGVIIDQAIHTLDLANWFINDKIVSVDAYIGNRAHNKIEVEDVAEGVIKYKNGVNVGFYAINYYTYDAPVEIELHCEKGFAKMVADKAQITFDDGRELIADRNPHESFGYGETGKNYWGVSHIKQIKNYYDALTHGFQPDITGETALITQRLICSIYESGRKNESIRF